MRHRMKGRCGPRRPGTEDDDFDAADDGAENGRRHRRWHGGFRARHGHHGRRRVLDAGELRLMLLKLIADEPCHGYELIQAITELTGGAYTPSPGVVYPALSMLEDMGHIEPRASEGARKAFAITDEGTAELAANSKAVEALFARLASLAETRSRIDAAPVKRAMDNLRTVLRTTLGREDAGKEMVHDVAAILDNAAQQIERLA